MRTRPPFSVGTFLLTGTLLFKCVQPAAASSSSTTNDDNFREDVFACEEAVARLAECCPNFDGKDIKCTYYYSRNETVNDCNGQTSVTTVQVEPAITTASAACIERTACADLVANGVCARALVAKSRGYTEYGKDVEVCQ
jgi:hypothetical protein